jgi:ribosomal protein S17
MKVEEADFQEFRPMMEVVGEDFQKMVVVEVDYLKWSPKMEVVEVSSQEYYPRMVVEEDPQKLRLRKVVEAVWCYPKMVVEVNFQE